MRLCHLCLPRTALVMCLHCWRQDAGLDRLVIWDTTVFPYVPSLIFFFWVQFVSVLVILAFSLLSHRDCWFRPADCWDRDSGVLHPGNYDSPWNCILGSHLAGDPAGHFTTQLPLPALLLVTLQSLLLYYCYCYLSILGLLLWCPVSSVQDVVGWKEDICILLIWGFWFFLANCRHSLLSFSCPGFASLVSHSCPFTEPCSAPAQPTACCLSS